MRLLEKRIMTVAERIAILVPDSNLQGPHIRAVLEEALTLEPRPDGESWSYSRSA